MLSWGQLIWTNLWLQVVNLKEARDFSNNKKFIYVFKVIILPFITFKFDYILRLLTFIDVDIAQILFSSLLWLFCLFHSQTTNLCYCWGLYWCCVCVKSVFNRNLNGNSCPLTYCLILICLRKLILYILKRK